MYLHEPTEQGTELRWAARERDPEGNRDGSRGKIRGFSKERCEIRSLRARKGGSPARSVSERRDEGREQERRRRSVGVNQEQKATMG